MPAAAVRHCPRIDTAELKLEMERRLGAQKAGKYFSLVSRFLSLQVGKSEFDRECVSLIGKENVRYHNELIKAIIRNAAFCKPPAPAALPKQGKSVGVNGVDPRNGLQSFCRDVFPQSPKKGRTPNIRERKFKDRTSLVTTKDGSVGKGKEVVPDEVCKRKSITAPFGVSVYSERKRKVLQKGLGRVLLEERLKKKLKAEGLDISPDCVNLLNNGLTSYLRRFIEPSLEFARARALHQPGTRFPVSLLDFRLAMETNPKVLGENCPTKLEKICFGSSHEPSNTLLDTNAKSGRTKVLE